MWTTLIIIVVVFLFLAQEGNKDIRKDEMAKMGLEEYKWISTGKYLLGHPEIDEQISNTFLIKENGLINIYDENKLSNSDFQSKTPEKKGEIKVDNIKSVTIENASTMEKKVTVGRMLAVGLFAFALKKKQMNELAYLVIKWENDLGAHETIFEFQDKGALESANRARNAVLRKTPKPALVC